jgi:hypothetical protein
VFGSTPEQQKQVHSSNFTNLSAKPVTPPAPAPEEMVESMFFLEYQGSSPRYPTYPYNQIDCPWKTDDMLEHALWFSRQPVKCICRVTYNQQLGDTPRVAARIF